MAKTPAKKPAPVDQASELPETVQAQVEHVLDGKIPKRELPVVAAKLTQIIVSEQFSGPIPHPKHLADYDAVLPGAAERILAMAEAAHSHIISTNERGQNAEIADTKRGMFYGAALFALLILCAFGAIFVTDNPIIIGLFLGTAAIGGVTAFIIGRK